MATTLYPNLTNLTDPGLQVAYMDGYTDTTEDVTLFDVLTTKLGRVTSRGYNPAPSYVVSSETHTIGTNDIEEAYGQQWDHVEYENGLALSRTSYLTLDPIVRMEWLQSMGNAGLQHLVDGLYDLFNNHIVTVGGDGQTLASTAHPSPVGTWSNRGSSAVDASAIEAAERALSNTLTPSGMRGELKGDVILSGTANRQAIFAALGSEFTSSNLQKSVTTTLPLRPVLSRAIDSTTAWWVCDSRQTRKHLKCYVLQGFSPIVVECHPDDWTFRVTDKFIRAINFGAPRGIYAGNV